MIAEIYALDSDGSIRHVYADNLPRNPDPGTTRVIRALLPDYQADIQAIADAGKSASWNGSAIEMDSVVAYDADWIAAREAEVVNASNRNTLQALTRDDAIVYFRAELAAAAGNGAAIATLYTQARAYEQANQMLSDTMLTLRTIEETASGLPMVLTTNQDRARYLKLFLTALALWS